jgi:molybdopterin-binding protein
MKMVTARVAAVRLGVGYSTLKNWIYAGRIRTTQTAGGHHRITEEELARFLAAGAHDPSRSRNGATPTRVIVALSGRNRLQGVVQEVRSDALMSQIRFQIERQTLIAVVTREALKELKLRRGELALAIIKSTDVMVARETASAANARRRR